MITTLEPPTVATSPFYSQGVMVTGAERTVYVAGQVGQRADGTVGDGVGQQAAIAVENMYAVLAEAGLTPEAIVKYTVYLTDPGAVPAFVEATAAALPSRKPAATLLVVSQLADPRLLVEIEAVAVG